MSFRSGNCQKRKKRKKLIQIIKNLRENNFFNISLHRTDKWLTKKKNEKSNKNNDKWLMWKTVLGIWVISLQQICLKEYDFYDFVSSAFSPRTQNDFNRPKKFSSNYFNIFLLWQDQVKNVYFLIGIHNLIHKFNYLIRIAPYNLTIHIHTDVRFLILMK